MGRAGAGPPFDGPVMDGDLATLAWLIELGADEAIGDVAVDRFALAATAAPVVAARPTAPLPAATATPQVAGNPPTLPAAALADAHGLAAGAADLSALRDAMAAFDGCALKLGARSLVFADGLPGAHVMIVGEAPGREEDRAGLPFVGRSGQLLDRMLAAIGLDRRAEDPARAVYITNVLPWRPPENREPSSDEIAMLKAFLVRHIALAAPRVLFLMGKTAAGTLMETATGITRLRGTWTQVLGRPALPTLHPAALLRNPVQKRLAWADLLALRAHLDGASP